MKQFKHGEITEKIIGSAMNVHGILGNGFQELIYQRALGVELKLNALSFEQEKRMKIFYKGVEVGTRRVDFLVVDKIMVEIKAVSQLKDEHLAQAINYLEAYHVEVGLLINFGQTSLQFKRLYNKQFKNLTHNPALRNLGERAHSVMNKI